jgi:hypothetical protein
VARSSSSSIPDFLKNGLYSLQTNLHIAMSEILSRPRLATITSSRRRSAVRSQAFNRFEQMAETHKKRFAVKRNTKTDPDVTTTAIMLIALHIAVDSTNGKRLRAGANFFTPRPLELDRFFVAIVSTVEGSGH